MSKSVYFLAFAILLASIDIIRTDDTAAATTSTDALPAKWEAAIRQMMKNFLESPTEEVYQMIAGEVAKLKVHIDVLFANSTEEKKDAFVEKVMKDIGGVMSSRRRSRVPAKFLIANVVIGDIIDNFGGFQPRKIPQDVMAQLKEFSEKLIFVCKQDARCKKML